MTQLERTQRELAYFVANLKLDDGQDEKLMEIVEQYVSLWGDRVWHDCYDMR
jgi:hypothetical protein